jgi:hypothetical protein
MLDFSRVTCATCRRLLAVSTTHGRDEAICCPLCVVAGLAPAAETGVAETGVSETGVSGTGRRRDHAPSRPRARPRAPRRTTWRITIGVF